MLGFLDKPEFDACFDIAQADRVRAGSSRSHIRIIRGQDRRDRNDDVEMHVGKRAPVELDRRARGVGFNGGAVDREQRIKFVVPELNGFRVVGLKRRPGPCSNRCGQNTKNGEDGQAQPNHHPSP
jgi:hypothetical protein